MTNIIKKEDLLAYIHEDVTFSWFAYNIYKIVVSLQLKNSQHC